MEGYVLLTLRAAEETRWLDAPTKARERRLPDMEPGEGEAEKLRSIKSAHWLGPARILIVQVWEKA